jgi:hypothetical protein
VENGMKAAAASVSILCRRPRRKLCIAVATLVAAGWFASATAHAGELCAGVARADITDRSVARVNDTLYAKALVLRSDATTVALITIDAVAIGELGRIKNDFLPNVRAALEKELHIPPQGVLINASHCHGVVCADVEKRTIQAVREAWRNLVPVNVGAGAGHEDRIMENRRLKMKDGSEADVRRAYAVPPDEDLAGVGPTDSQIGLLRLDRKNGKPLAVVYNFACHPIQGVPSGGSTADIFGFASKVIEEGLGDGAMALFLQGCAGDINPVVYKNVHNPHNAEPLGNMLGLSAMRAIKAIQPKADRRLSIVRQTLALPRAADSRQRIAAIEAQQTRLLRSLKGTSLNLKTFLPLLVQYKVSGDFPADYAYRYLHEQAIGRDDLSLLDAENRANMDAYIQNIHVMEQLTRLQTNLNLLKIHQAQNLAAGNKPLDVEVAGLRVGDFVLLTFPGELTVEIGLNIKRRAPAPLTFVAGYTNGYIYYAPTARQRSNLGYAQEDCDCLLAPEWQKLFEERAHWMLKDL